MLALPEDFVRVHMSMRGVLVCVCVHMLSYPLSIKRVFAYTHGTYTYLSTSENPDENLIGIVSSLLA